MIAILINWMHILVLYFVFVPLNSIEIKNNNPANFNKIKKKFWITGSSLKKRFKL
jgi:hypothetical protein